MSLWFSPFWKTNKQTKKPSKHCSPFKCISLARTLLTTLINEFQSPTTFSFYHSPSIYFLLSIYHLPCPFNLLSCSGCLFLHILPLYIQCLEHCLAHGMCSINGSSWNWPYFSSLQTHLILPSRFESCHFLGNEHTLSLPFFQTKPHLWFFLVSDQDSSPLRSLPYFSFLCHNQPSP